MNHHHPKWCEDCPQQPQDCEECTNNPLLYLEVNTGQSEIEKLAFCLIPQIIKSMEADNDV